MRASGYLGGLTWRTKKEPIVGGKTDQAKGRIKKAVGELTNDDRLKAKGTIDKAAGKVKDAVDTVKNKVKGK
jgi:uncharacterized protein YjbJ (UPF0337 family)